MYKVVINKQIGGFGFGNEAEAFIAALLECEELSSWVDRPDVEYELDPVDRIYFANIPRHHPALIKLVEEHRNSLEGQYEVVELIYPTYSIFDDGRGVEYISVISSHQFDARIIPKEGEVEYHPSSLVPIGELQALVDSCGKSFHGVSAYQLTQDLVALIVKYTPGV